MRYPPEHKEETRGRIVRAASRRFRANGGSGSAITSLMRDLRLTHGGFYRHFSSKDQLFEEALQASATEMSTQIAAVADGAPANEALRAIVTTYLSEAHCDNPSQGCPLAALGSDLTRLPRRSRDACHRILMGYASRMARYLPGADHEARERRAVLLFSSMAGVLTLARTISDRSERQRLLSDAVAFHLGGST